MAEAKRMRLDKRTDLLHRTEGYLMDSENTPALVIRILKNEELLKPENISQTVADCEADVVAIETPLREEKKEIDRLYKCKLLFYMLI